MALDDDQMERWAQEARILDAQLKPQRDMHAAATATLQQAAHAVDDIVHEIKQFEASIDPAEEARMVVVGGPIGTAIFLQSVMPLGHDRILFSGTDQDGCRVSVMQHVSQLNLMLKAVKVGEAKARRTPIGFHSADDRQRD